jgi:hypothetical protein
LASSVRCERCGFEVTIELKLGYLAEFVPDQRKMRAACKRAAETDFAFDCPDLTSALLAVLDRQKPFPLAGIHHLPTAVRDASGARPEGEAVRAPGCDAQDIDGANDYVVIAKT